MPKTDFRFHFTIRVRWSECDAQGIAFNGSAMEYLEIAQGEYYRNLGHRIYDEKQREYFDTATVKATLEYKAPILVDEIIDVYTRVSNIGTTSIVMETEIYRESSEELLVKAELVYVDYDAALGTSRAVPDDVRELLNHFEETGQVLPIKRFPNLARGSG